eukprot:TRINITY_DN35521_c0_g1_i1.p1 TRINITY_DN35521_c0_g1~~TRINITY_DN35521_c0_g1_i1.p1  ORF type:complete len:1279 (+),score=178.27 TRINITY_DN35521_c0_g1_i1:69-3905(+)
MADANEDPAKRAVRICLHLFGRVNKVFLLFTNCVRVLLLPQLSRYQYRVYLTYALQVFTSDICIIFFSKALQEYYAMNNLLFLLSAGSLMPFAKVVVQLWSYIPCPPVAAVISNTALVIALVTLFVLGYGTYNGNPYVVYTYMTAVWPWMVLASMISRLFIERKAGKNPFSPLKEIPFLGLLGALSEVFTFMAIKDLTCTDCVCLLGMDHIIAAAVASAFLGKQRRRIHFRALKAYVMMMICTFLYSTAGSSKDAFSTLFSSSRLLFLTARFFKVLRSVFVKWKYAKFHRSKEPVKPPESGLLFYANQRPKIHRFVGFPSPMLLTLDCIFDSGLRDIEFHGMGPLGTEDLHSLTEFAYMLPFASLAAWLTEFSTLSLGLAPQIAAGGITAAVLAGEAVDAATKDGAATIQSSGSEAPNIAEAPGSTDNVYCFLLVILVCVSRLLRPTAMARTLFDRASPQNQWKYQPILIVAPVFCADVLMLNSHISKYQVVVILALGAINGVYRADLWNAFKRKFLLLTAQDLQYQNPSTLRALQKKTLLEVLNRTSTDDFGVMLMQTSVSHGSNIRELARDTNIQVWDPAPAATAAWKLAVSMVTKSLRRQKLLRKTKLSAKEEVYKYIEDLIHKMVFTAVDTAAGNGARMRIAGSLASVTAKRRALAKLRSLAITRRTLRAKRRAGQLAIAPANLATAGGILRNAKDIRASLDMGNTITERSRQLSALPAPPDWAGSTMGSANGGFAGPGPGPQLPMSLTSHHGGDTGGGMSPSGQFSPARTQDEFHMPGEAQDSVGDFSFDATMSAGGFAATMQSQLEATQCKRGVWSEGVYFSGGPPSGSLLIIAFGDAKRGQLGVEPSKGARHIARTCNLIVEELRGQQPVQVEAAGVASFVVGLAGQLWGFGSNRAMELGSRKEVSQISAPQRIKSVRAVKVAQVASSTSASGQAHTLVLGRNGEVHTFGASTSGALGQGPDVKQSGPLLLRFTSTIPIRQVAAGARHSMLLTDAGKLFSMGDNAHGQLGIDHKLGLNAIKSADTPTQVIGELAREEVIVKSVVCGDNYSLALTKDDQLYVWGANSNGQLGLQKLADQPLPQPQLDLQGLGICGLACGSRHSLAITDKGTRVWAWGSNVQGQLGIGVNRDGHQRSQPIIISALSNKKGFMITQVAAAACHSLAVNSIGEVYGFGDNSNGQLGFPTLTSKELLAPPNQLPQTQHQQVQMSTKQTRVKQMEDVRKANEIDQPRAFGDGVETLWLPACVVSLLQYRVKCVSTADLHSLAVAQTD